jgi:hypothetical protein
MGNEAKDIEIPVSITKFQDLWESMTESEEVFVGKDEGTGFRAIECRHGNITLKFVVKA